MNKIFGRLGYMSRSLMMVGGPEAISLNKDFVFRKKGRSLLINS